LTIKYVSSLSFGVSTETGKFITKETHKRQRPKRGAALVFLRGPCRASVEHDVAVPSIFAYLHQTNAKFSTENVRLKIAAGLDGPGALGGLVPNALEARRHF
jgi:hypothetical protein